MPRSSVWLALVALSLYALLTGVARAAGPGGGQGGQPNQPIFLNSVAQLKQFSTPPIASSLVCLLGYNNPGDAGDPWCYKPQFPPGPCSLNFGAGDGGSQIPMFGDGNCALASFSSAGVDIRKFGATPTADIMPFIAKAYAANPNSKIIIPAGVWQVQSAVTFGNQPPEIEGVGWSEHNAAATCPTSVVGETWLHEAVGAEGITPFTLSNPSSAGHGYIKNIAFCQDHPAPGVGWTPNIYNPLFVVNNTAGEFDFENDYFFAIYQAINIPGSNGANGRIGLFHLRGQVFSYLLNADNVLDVLHGEDAHIWNFWSSNSNVLSWQEANGNVLILGRVDGFMFPDFFALGYHSCIHFISTSNGVSTGSQWPGFYCDIAKYPIWVEGSGVTAHFPSAYLAGGNITGSWSVQLDGNVSGAQILIGSLVSIATGGGAVDLHPAGGFTGNAVRIATGYVHAFNQDNNGSAAFSVTTGNSVEFGTAPLVGTSDSNSGPIVDVTSTGDYNLDLWLSYTPTLACNTGTLTAAIPTGLYRRSSGNSVQLQLNISITTNGTCAGNITATLPPLAQTTSNASLMAGRENAITGKALTGYNNGTSQAVAIQFYDNTYPGANSANFVLSGTYQSN